LKIAIIDCGAGNIYSVKRALERLAVSVVLVSSPDELRGCDKLVLPGVGHFARAVQHLDKTGLGVAINQAVIAERRPVLGICLGMELFAVSSEEGGVSGLGWVDACAVRFRISDTVKYKVPAIGWGRLTSQFPSRLFTGISDDSEFYFLHSYYLSPADEGVITATAEYESIYPASIETGNIFGVQFHPEKSHDAGMQLLQNFVAT
jgi:glutamine amidotransferase